jgi:hypothetical protein
MITGEGRGREMRRERMKRIYKYGAAALGMIGAATGLYAADHFNNGTGTDRGYFWTIYNQGTEYARINVLNNTGKALISWKTNFGSGNDFAGGIGWERKAKPNNIFYSIASWKNYAVGDNAVFGAYGWSCNNAGELNVEFYITEAWFGGGRFVPGDGAQLKSNITLDGDTYDIYVTGGIKRAQRCTNGRNFQQVWAVRRNKRSVGATAVTMSFSKFIAKMDDYAFFRNYDYLVIGIDGFQGSSGDVTLGSLSRN